MRPVKANVAVWQTAILYILMFGAALRNRLLPEADTGIFGTTYPSYDREKR